MNIQQMEYILAVDAEKHFVKAAEKCFVTQATLSMMIKKLEEELGVIIFDRSKQPVMATEIGELLINQARVVVQESKKMAQIVKEAQTIIVGEIKIGIIPTVAPYLLPLFLSNFLEKYPQVKITIREINTNSCIEQLKKGVIDLAILATPLYEDGIKEEHLYYEKFKVFSHRNEAQTIKKMIVPEEIDLKKLLLLEEGHCLRGQVINICSMQKNSTLIQHLDYKAGSIESLINLVESYQGVTIVPELCMHFFSDEQKLQVSSFISPEPVREIGMISYRYFAKDKTKKALMEEIKWGVAKLLEPKSEQMIIPA